MNLFCSVEVPSALSLYVIRGPQSHKGHEEKALCFWCFSGKIKLRKARKII